MVFGLEMVGDESGDAGDVVDEELAGVELLLLAFVEAAEVAVVLAVVTAVVPVETVPVDVVVPVVAGVEVVAFAEVVVFAVVAVVVAGFPEPDAVVVGDEVAEVFFGGAVEVVVVVVAVVTFTVGVLLLLFA